MHTFNTNHVRQVYFGPRSSDRDARRARERLRKSLPTRHSLGAQIAAFASNACALPELFGVPVRAILAADPAGPLFEGRLAAERLDPSDAQEVIVVHTTDMLGVKSPVGTVDTYVSWPESQPADAVARHSLARELVTNSFVAQGLVHADGTPFGANALGLGFPDQNPKTYLVRGEARTAFASRN